MTDYDKYASKNLKYLQANCMTLAIICKYCPQRLLSRFSEGKCLAFVTACASSDKTPVCLSALRSICYLIEHQVKSNQKVENDVASILAKVDKHDTFSSLSHFSHFSFTHKQIVHQ